MPENFAQMVATIKHYVSLIFRAFLGPTKLMIAMQFVFQKPFLIVPRQKNTFVRPIPPQRGNF